MPVLPGAEPFRHDGSSATGILLCHGFTGTPATMRPWGEQLAAAGYTVRCPRLPGHGTTWQDANRTTWQDWYRTVRAELVELLEQNQPVFVFGLSMGGTLTLRLAQEFGSAIAGIVLVNPSVMTVRKDVKLWPLLGKLVPSVRGLGGDIAKPGAKELSYPRVPVRAATSLSRLWPLVRADLGKVSQPLLLLHSVVDHVVEPVNSAIVLREVASTDVTEVLLHNSYHVATLDYDAPIVFRRSIEFVQAIESARQVNQL